MNELHQRITSVRKSVAKKQDDFAELLGVTRGTLSHIEIGRTPPSIEFLLSLHQKLKVSFDWLLTGEGDMFIDKKKITNPQIAPAPENKTSFPVKHFGMPVVVTVDEGGIDNIVMVDIKAAAGYAHNITEPKFIKKLPAMKLHGSEFRNGIFRGYQVEGDSMYDTLDHNDWVVGRYCDNHWQDIKEGYIHVIVSKTDVWVKRLLNRVEERGKIVLLSDNEQYPTRDVDVEEVQEIWVVKARLTYNLRSRRIDWFKKYNDVQAEMVDIKSRLVNLERGGKLK